MAAKRGRWADVIKTLPKLPFETENPKYDEVVRARVSVLAAELTNPKEAAARWKQLRISKEALEDKLSNLNAELAAMQQLVVLLYEQEGIQSLTFSEQEGGGTIAHQPEPWAKVEDKRRFADWCIQDPDLKLALSLPWQTTNSLAKARLEAGEDFPPGVGMYCKDKLVWRK